jgi:hypothetical protein
MKKDKEERRKQKEESGPSGPSGPHGKSWQKAHMLEQIATYILIMHSCFVRTHIITLFTIKQCPIRTRLEHLLTRITDFEYLDYRDSDTTQLTTRSYHTHHPP